MGLVISARPMATRGCCPPESGLDWQHGTKDRGTSGECCSLYIIPAPLPDRKAFRP